jgi:hypothetical protein
MIGVHDAVDNSHYRNDEQDSTHENLPAYVDLGSDLFAHADEVAAARSVLASADEIAARIIDEANCPSLPSAEFVVDSGGCE